MNINGQSNLLNDDSLLGFALGIFFLTSNLLLLLSHTKTTTQAAAERTVKCSKVTKSPRTPKVSLKILFFTTFFSFLVLHSN